MPDMDGLEATAAVRQLPGYENVPILALTANYSDEIRQQCQQHGMQDFLSKPITPPALWTRGFALAESARVDGALHSGD